MMRRFSLWASPFFHELSVYPIGRGPSHHPSPTVTFCVQAGKASALDSAINVRMLGADFASTPKCLKNQTGGKRSFMVRTPSTVALRWVQKTVRETDSEGAVMQMVPPNHRGCVIPQIISVSTLLCDDIDDSKVFKFHINMHQLYLSGNAILLEKIDVDLSAPMLANVDLGLFV